MGLFSKKENQPRCCLLCGREVTAGKCPACGREVKPLVPLSALGWQKVPLTVAEALGEQVVRLALGGVLGELALVGERRLQGRGRHGEGEQRHAKPSQRAFHSSRTGSKRSSPWPCARWPHP